MNDAAGTRGYEHQSSLAADPVTPSHLAAVWTQDFEDASVVSITQDGGRSWAAAGVPGQMPACEGDVVFDTVNNPRASIGADGTVYVVSNVSSTRTGDQAVRVNALSGDGSGWVGSEDLEAGGSLDWVSVAADPRVAGRAFVSWGHRDFDSSGNLASAYENFAMTTNGGRDWTRFPTHPEPAGGTTYQFGQLFVLADGSLLDVFEQCGLDQCAQPSVLPSGDPTATPGHVRASRTADAGQRWSAVGAATDAPTGWFAAALAPDGTVDVVVPAPTADGTWQLWLSSSDDRGLSWRRPALILDGDPKPPTSLTLVVAGDGTIGALFYDKRNAGLSPMPSTVPKCQYDDGSTCVTDAWLLTGLGRKWTSTHLAGPFEATRFDGADCCHGLGEWQGLVGRPIGFDALLTLGPSDTSPADPDQQVVDGPTDTFLVSPR